MREATLTLGLPHTNRWGLAEHLLMQYAGHLHWCSIAAAIGTPLSKLRTAEGGEVYATFYFVETEFPEETPIESFQLDDTIRFLLEQRAFKGIAIEGQFIFDHADRLTGTAENPAAFAALTGRRRRPYVRFGNIFITPTGGNSLLRVAAPINGDFSVFPVLPNDENPYHLTRAAADSGRLGVIDDSTWSPAGDGHAVAAEYVIDPDRDTNGAGLVYFANYFVFMDAAERAAAARCGVPAVRDADGRLVRVRRTAFYGNIDLSDRLRTSVKFFHKPAQESLIGVRYAIHREGDGALICLSEAIKRCVRA